MAPDKKTTHGHFLFFDKNMISQLMLIKIEVYGFDYDYTLASYTPELHDLIYDLGRDSLVYNSKYPDGLRKMKYDPNFAVRGLHYDVRKGLLMKIDSFHHIMLGTVYRSSNKDNAFT
ncbi:unnamed protein product [Acanthosepion pharaonis]|uniref:Uncharacterized protein n=1 Tax=Acanthosepion pharaonis TaxID=158019 RepID=A0A812AMR1_ACAPH|nr:unnamed protein product [Sepia pharaonis]